MLKTISKKTILRFIKREQKNKARTATTGFVSGGVTCKLRALCFYSSSVLVDSFVLRNPPERKVRKRVCIESITYETSN